MIRRTLTLFLTGIPKHRVTRTAASLAYNLLFALFPLLIFLNNLLAMLDLDVFALTPHLQKFLPNSVVGLITSYLEHISGTSSGMIFWFSLIFTVYFPLRAAGHLMDDVRRAHGLSRPQKPLPYLLKQILYTLLLLLVILLAPLLAVSGRELLTFISSNLLSKEMQPFMNAVISFWQYFRFVLLGILMFIALATLYDISPDERPPVRKILPGTLIALVSWFAVSIAFTFFAENVANYSLLYGTLSALVVMLIWLYLTSFCLIMGAEFNSALNQAIEESKNANKSTDTKNTEE